MVGMGLGLLALPHVAHACAACFSAAAAGQDDPMLQAVNLAMGCMAGLTICVLAGFAGFFIYLKRCAHRASMGDHDA